LIPVEKLVPEEDAGSGHFDVLTPGDGELPGAQPGRAAIDLASSSGPGSSDVGGR
jgi:hypothetical protein